MVTRDNFTLVPMYFLFVRSLGRTSFPSLSSCFSSSPPQTSPQATKKSTNQKSTAFLQSRKQQKLFTDFSECRFFCRAVGGSCTDNSFTLKYMICTVGLPSYLNMDQYRVSLVSRCTDGAGINTMVDPEVNFHHSSLHFNLFCDLWTIDLIRVEIC